MKFNDAVFGAIFLVLGLAIVVHVQSFPAIPGQQVGPALFPGLVAAGLAVCGVLLIASGLRHRSSQPWFVAEAWTRSTRHVAGFAAVVAAVAFYIAFANTLGFLVVGPLILFGLFVMFGVRPATAALVAVVATLVIWYAFYKLLRVPLPWGVLTKFAF
ncbi:MAG: tripartite tricarboxylate transporter TctB family protein [Burkholderiales bacterium]|jgi:putative tricarboxylic transport membrane protein|nr:tripartite tricarboxylate transporter TctB family protein [Burkholderiales bacterium]